MSSALVSVIIATKNEERNIERCIKSLREQDYKKIEIIVVDNNSYDRTREIARKYIQKIFSLPKDAAKKGVKNLRGAQINLGVKKSMGKIIFFPDADMTFSKGLIKEAVELLKKSDALFVPEIIIGKGFIGKIRKFEREFYNRTVVDAVRFVKKAIFLKSGGFDSRNITFGPDDWDFTKTLKKNCFELDITLKPLFHHEEDITLLKYLNKKEKYVSSFEDYVKKWGKKEEDIKKQLGFYYRFFGVFTENEKWRKLISHPILTIGMYSLRIIVGINYILKRK